MSIRTEYVQKNPSSSDVFVQAATSSETTIEDNPSVQTNTTRRVSNASPIAGTVDNIKKAVAGSSQAPSNPILYARYPYTEAGTALAKANLRIRTENDSLYKPNDLKLELLSVHDPVAGILTIVDDTGKYVDLINLNVDQETQQVTKYLSPTFNTFIIQSVTRHESDKIQLSQTFGETYAYIYGRNPVTASIALLVPHSTELPLADIFEENFNKKFRSHLLVRRKQVAVLSWNTTSIVGYPLSLHESQANGQDQSNVRAMSMEFFIVDAHNAISAEMVTNRQDGIHTDVLTNTPTSILA